jgi:hypothetical protein
VVALSYSMTARSKAIGEKQPCKPHKISIVKPLALALVIAIERVNIVLFRNGPKKIKCAFYRQRASESLKNLIDNDVGPWQNPASAAKNSCAAAG